MRNTYGVSGVSTRATRLHDFGEPPGAKSSVGSDAISRKVSDTVAQMSPYAIFSFAYKTPIE